MKIFGDQAICFEIIDKLNYIATTNAAFKIIWANIQNMPIDIVVGSEQDMINDSHNTSKTLHEFRGYYLNGVIYLFNTRYETIESLTHSVLHELCHAMIALNAYTMLVLQTITGQFIAEKGYNIDLSSDFWAQKSYEDIIKSNDIHDQLPEEKLCDDFATSLIGFRYDRSWWWNRWEEID